MGCGASAAHHGRAVPAAILFVQVRPASLPPALCTTLPDIVDPPPRPQGAVGTFLRMVTINDVYSLENYPKVATAISLLRHAAESLDCVVTSHLNGDFLSPCILSALDSGKAMMEGLNQAGVEFACLGNHEFDLGHDVLADRLPEFKGKIINSNVKADCCQGLPRYHALRVGDRTVVFAGVLTNNTECFPASALKQLEIVPVTDALKSVWREARSELGSPDVLIPMTHQEVLEDKTTAEVLSQDEDLRGRVPVMLGGHDHEIYTPVVCGTRIVKMGMDAVTIGFVDVWWDADGQAHSSLQQVPAASFADEARSAKWVEEQARKMGGMLEVPIAHLPWPCSSERVRLEESKLASFLLQIVKRGLRMEGVELVMNVAGNIRGKRAYDSGAFTLADLYSEIPYDCPQAIVRVPGSILVETVRTMRSPEGEKPGFLHLDLDCQVAEGHELLKIGGRRVDPDFEYTLAIDRDLLTGMNSVEPLLTLVRSGSIRVPDDEQCQPMKQLVVSVLMKDTWRQILGMGKFDPGGRSDTPRVTLKEKLAREFTKLDTDNNGLLGKQEVLSALREKRLSSKMVEKLISSVDSARDGVVDLVELGSILQ